MCSRIQSSFNGKITEIPGIAVDNFEAHSLRSRAFFLSHCHSDHTKGLFTPELLEALKYNGVYIYTSELSRAIIEDDCNNDKLLMDHIRTLRLGANDISLPKVFGYEEAFLRVTTIPAGHCLGSIMFLFETKNKEVILYTGDFNISSNDLTHMNSFHDKNKDAINIDVIYVDTTFISKEYKYFPKRSVVIEQMIDQIDKWLKADAKNRVALSTSAKYGYEFVFNKIFAKLKLQVFVNNERWQFYRKHLQLKSITNSQENAKIHICRNFNAKNSHNSCSVSGTQCNFLFIRLSAMKWSGYALEETGVNRVDSNWLDVCFPTHCSRSEIINFVNYFMPRKVVGFPNKYQNEQKRTSIKEITPKKRKLSFKIPNEVDKKIDKDLLKKIFE